jgi:hypothetical protein
MRTRVQNWWRAVRAGRREDKIMRCWQSKKYDKLAGMFKQVNDYNSFKVHGFAFLYFLIYEKDA